MKLDKFATTGKTVAIVYALVIFQTPEHEGMSPRQSDQVFATDRSCTDILALIVLIGLVIGFVRSIAFFYSLSFPLSLV